MTLHGMCCSRLALACQALQLGLQLGLLPPWFLGAGPEAAASECSLQKHASAAGRPDSTIFPKQRQRLAVAVRQEAP